VAASARDSLLALGGLQARAAQNRLRTTTANLRVPTLVGVSAYLVYLAVTDLAFSVPALTWTGPAH